MSTTATASKANPRTRRPRRSKTRHQLDAQSKQAVKQLIRYWAREFRFSQGRTVEAIVKHGAKLNEGRKALIETLGHGHWLAALEEAGIGERTAQMYMRIAIQPWANPAELCGFAGNGLCPQLPSGSPVGVRPGLAGRDEAQPHHDEE